MGGVKEENIDIKLEDGMLTVQGKRTASSESSQFTSKFSKTFSLDNAVDVAAPSIEGEKNASTSSDENNGSEKTEQHKENEEEEVKSMDAEKGKTSDSSKNGKV